MIIPLWLLLVILFTAPLLLTWLVVKIGGQWGLLSTKRFFLDKTGFIYPLYIALFFYAIVGFLDLMDWYSKQSFIGEVVGTGIIDSGQTFVLFLTLLAIVAYTFETYRLRDITYVATNEAAKANELRLRPYLSLHWDSSFKSSGRRGEQVTDTCLLARNDGVGLMRKVTYSVEVNGQQVSVRNHNIITPGKSGTAVVYSSKNANDFLGDRNDHDKVASNNELISTKIKTARISGEYEDVNGTKYEYSFVRDDNEQSWFREEWQRRKPLAGKSVS